MQQINLYPWVSIDLNIYINTDDDENTRDICYVFHYPYYVYAVTIVFV